MNRIRNFWKKLGPGLVTGAADDDPSGIATYSQMGAQRGFELIWLSLFSYPLMIVIQEMCARIGLVTGKGLAANIKQYYSKKILYVCTALLLFANIFNIGADLGAMAEAMRLVLPGAPFALLVLFLGIISLILEIFVSYRKYAKYLKYLTFVLFAYIISALLVEMNWGEVLRNLFIPTIHFSKDSLMLLCAAVGTTISPYLFFWQSSQEVEEKILNSEKGEGTGRAEVGVKDIKNMRLDVWSGMFISNLVMFFIIAACASTLFTSGITNIDSASDAALALRPFAGDFAYFLFALGILGTGLLAIPVLAASASYAMSETFGWREGLSLKLKQATSFYGVIIVAIVLGILFNFIGLDPIRALIYSALLNGIISPLMIFFIIHLSGKESLMGDFKNKKSSNFFGWFTFVVISLVSVGGILAIFL